MPYLEAYFFLVAYTTPLRTKLFFNWEKIKAFGESTCFVETFSQGNLYNSKVNFVSPLFLM